MKSRLLSIILLLISFGASAQVDSVLSDFNASINVFYATGSAPTFRIQALINNTTGRYSSTDVQVGDIIYLNEADKCVRFRVDVVSAVGSAIQATVTDIEGVVSGFPLGIGFITRETANYSFPLHVDGVSSDLLSCARTHFTLLVDRITGGGADTDSIYYTLNGDLVLVTRKDTIPLPSVIDTTFASNDTLYIVSGGDTTFAIISTTDTDKQNLSLVGDSLLIERGKGVDLSVYRDTFTGAGADTDSIYFDNRDSIRLILRGDTISLPPDLVYDGDSSITNELQDIDSVVLSGNLLTVYISNGASASVDLSGITLTDRADTSGYNLTFYIQNDSLNLIDGIGNLRVDLSPYLDNTDTSGYNQTLSLSNDTLYLTDGASTLQVYIPSAIDTSFSSGDTLFIVSNGDTNAIVLSVPGDNWGAQVVVSDATLDGDGRSVNPLKIAQQGATSGQVLKWNGSTWQPADDIDTDTDTDTDEQNLSIVGDSLLIERGSGVDLSVYLDNTDTDSIVVDSLGTLLVKNRGDVITLIPDTDTDTDEQNLSLLGDSLLIERGTGVDLSGYLDNTDGDTIIVDSAGVKTYTVTRNGTIYIPGGDGTGTDTSGYNQSFTKVGDSLILVDGTTRFAVYDADSVGSFVLPTDSITFNNNESGPDEAELNWDETLGYLVYGGLGNQLIQIGQDQYWMTVNQSGGPILKGEVVRAAGATGNSGKFLIEKYLADGNTDPNYLLGVAAHDIPNGSEGYVMHQGKIRQIDLTDYQTGQVLYVSPTIAGDWVTIEPANGYQKLPIAFVVDSSANGTLAVRVKTGEALRDLHDVDVSSPSDGSLIAYDSVLGYWVTKADSVIDDDADSTNELQSLSLQVIQAGSNKTYILTLSNDTTIQFTDNVDDADALKTNEGSLTVGSNTIISNTQGSTDIQLLEGDSIQIQTDPLLNSITISNTAPDKVVAITGSGATTVTGTYPNFTISSTDNVIDNDNDPTNELDNTDEQELGWTQSTGVLTLESSPSVTISTFNGTTRGLVPDSDASTTKYLRGDGTFQVPPDNTGTDDQQIEKFQLTGTDLTLAIEDDGQADQTVSFTGWDTDASDDGTVTSVGGTGSVNGITLTGTVTSTGNLTLGGTLGISNDDWTIAGADLSLTNGGTGSSLSDPNDDRLMYWDDALNATGWIDLGNGLNISTTMYVDSRNMTEATTFSPSDYMIIDDVSVSGLISTRKISPSNINLSAFNNDVPFLTTEVDGSITNEIQSIDRFDLTGTDLEISLSSDAAVEAVSFSGWDTNAADDFDGVYTSLDFTGTTGLSDGIDNNDNDIPSDGQGIDVGALSGSSYPVNIGAPNATSNYVTSNRFVNYSGAGDFIYNMNAGLVKIRDVGASGDLLQITNSAGTSYTSFTEQALTYTGSFNYSITAANNLNLFSGASSSIVFNTDLFTIDAGSRNINIGSPANNAELIVNGQTQLEDVPQDNSNTRILSVDASTNLVEWVDASTIGSAGSDDQTIDVFSLAGNVLSLSLESDGEATKTVTFTNWDTDVTDDLTMLNGSNNRLVTSNTTSQLNAEADLTFDGSTLDMPNKLTVSGTQVVYYPAVDDADIDNTIVFGNGGNNLVGNNPTAEGDANTFIGMDAGLATTSGYRNTFVGADAGTVNTTGNSNTFIGMEAGFDNTTGNENSFLGFRAGYNNISGIQNTFFGTSAGDANTTGLRNNYIGYQAGYSATAGTDNTFIGYRAGRYQTDGTSELSAVTSSVYIGGGTRGTQSATNEIVIGQGATGAGSNTIKFGNENITYNYFNGQIGVNGGASTNTLRLNETDGGAKLGFADDNTSLEIHHFDGGGTGTNSQVNFNLFTGNNTSPATIGYFRSTNTSGAVNVSIFKGNNTNTLNSLIAGNGNTYFAADNGNVGFGMNNPSVKLDVTGDIEYTGTITDVSDERLKFNIQNLSNSLEKILLLNPVSYNQLYSNKIYEKEYGLIAQDVQKQFPEMVKVVDNKEGVEYYGLSYTQLIAPMIQAIQEQQAQIEELKARISELENR